MRRARSERKLVSSLYAWRYFDLSALALIVVVTVALDLLWMSIDTRPPYVDYARHLGDSLYYRSTFSFAHPLRPLTAYVLYPPFVYWVTDAFYAVLGTGQWVAVLSNIVFISILVASTYGIGKRLWGRGVGLLAALFVLTTPMFTSMLKQYMLDAPLAAMVTAALYFLIRSESFAHRRASLLLGAVCGLGLLTKVVFGLCFGLPALAAVGTAVAQARRERSAVRLVNMAAAGLVTFAISGVWYLHNWSQVMADSHTSASYTGSVPGQPETGNLASVLWYFWNLVDNQLYLIPFCFLAVGVVYVFRRGESAARNEPLVLTIVGTYISFTLLQNKDYRYTMAMLPAAAIVGTHWLVYLRPAVRRRLGAGLVAYCVLAFAAISFGTSLLPQKIAIGLPVRPYTSNLYEYGAPVGELVRGVVVFAQHGFYDYGKPTDTGWDEESAFKLISALGGRDATFVYRYDTDSMWFNTWAVRYWYLRYHLTWVANLDETNFVLIRQTGRPATPAGFGLLRDYPLPDGGTLWLFRRH